MPHARFLDHFQHPRGQGSLPHATHAARVSDPACGDELELDLVVRAGVVEEARFRVRGCTAAIAAGSALATLLPGREAHAGSVTRAELEAELGEVPPTKRHALRLVDRALAAALQSSSTT